MAELNQNENHSKGGKARTNLPAGRQGKLSIKMDMTPMVDLAFLLLTFFMLTTTFNKPKVMEINMPVPGPFEPVPNNTVTLLLGESDKLVYYQGIFNPNNQSLFHKSGYDKTQIRADLMSLNQKLIDAISKIEEDYKNGLFNDSIYHVKVNEAMKTKSNEGVFVIIKAAEKSRYENIVSIIDEMKICNMVNYSIVDITKEEEKVLASLY